MWNVLEVGAGCWTLNCNQRNGLSPLLPSLENWSIEIKLLICILTSEHQILVNNLISILWGFPRFFGFFVFLINKSLIIIKIKVGLSSLDLEETLWSSDFTLIQCRETSRHGTSDIRFWLTSVRRETDEG